MLLVGFPLSMSNNGKLGKGVSYMYAFYYYNINTDSKGNHEVHREDCSYLPNSQNRVYISYESNCHSAIQSARRATGKTNFDGCYFCSKECHTG